MSCRTYEAKLKMFRNHMHQYINDLRKTLVLPHSLEVLGVSLQMIILIYIHDVKIHPFLNQQGVKYVQS